MTRQSQLKAHNCLAIPSLLHGCEMSILKNGYKKTTNSGYSLLEHRRKVYIMEDLKLFTVEKKFAQYE